VVLITVTRRVARARSTEKAGVGAARVKQAVVVRHWSINSRNRIRYPPSAARAAAGRSPRKGDYDRIDFYTRADLGCKHCSRK
jgi:hypothetical protein